MQHRQCRRPRYSSHGRPRLGEGSGPAVHLGRHHARPARELGVWCATRDQACASREGSVPNPRPEPLRSRSRRRGSQSVALGHRCDCFLIRRSALLGPLRKKGAERLLAILISGKSTQRLANRGGRAAECRSEPFEDLSAFVVQSHRSPGHAVDCIGPVSPRCLGFLSSELVGREQFGCQQGVTWSA